VENFNDNVNEAVSKGLKNMISRIRIQIIFPQIIKRAEKKYK